VNKGEYTGSSWGQLVSDIHSDLYAFQHWEMNFLPRQCNQVAHALARMAMANNVWFTKPPECIHLTLMVEHYVLIFP
jgi:hypothetical protein